MLRLLERPARCSRLMEDLWPAKLGDAVTDAAVEEVGSCGYPKHSRLKWPCLWDVSGVKPSFRTRPNLVWYFEVIVGARLKDSRGILWHFGGNNVQVPVAYPVNAFSRHAHRWYSMDHVRLQGSWYVSRISCEVNARESGYVVRRVVILRATRFWCYALNLLKQLASALLMLRAQPS